MSNLLVVIASLFYLALLFGVAWYAEFRLKKGKSIINNGYVYALSLSVYCTAWTYYGSVGRASVNGVEFLAIYLGPTIAAILFWPFLQKMIRICKTQHINSIADLISTRYGKNFSIAVIVTILCVVGVIPYISLLLKAISNSIHLLTGPTAGNSSIAGFLDDKTFYIAAVLTVFIILFGTRSVDASEKHEGLVAAIAFESIVKLIAFIAAGIFIVYGIFNGFESIFTPALNDPELRNLFTLGDKTSYGTWLGLLLVSMLAVFFLPRQFQVSVVENNSEAHIKKATWMFPLYLFLINIFVLPVAIAGKLIFAGTAIDADTFVLALPLHYGHQLLSLFIFIGGFSAATSMIIVETIALSTMMSNNIATPLLLSAKKFKPAQDGLLSRSILHIRRISIAIIILLAYIYDKTIAQNQSLVSIGLVSFVAVAQFAPAVIGGLYWKDASKNGAIAGIFAGFAVWFFTLVIPSLVSAGIVNESILQNGLFGLSWLKPFSLFGMEGFDSITHAAFWSLLFNTVIFVSVSVNSKKTSTEIYQAEIFVDIFKHSARQNKIVWQGSAYLEDIYSLLDNFIGTGKSEKIIKNYAARNRISLETKKADPALVNFAEKLLSGVIGSASAHIMIRSATKEEELKIDEVISMLRESQQIMELNKELRRKSAELKKATQQLSAVNEQLKQMDLLKDEFLYTVTHELRTPLTSIRAMSEIVHDNEDMPPEEKQLFLGNVIKETERLSHLITQVLNLEKYESGRQVLNLTPVVFNTLVKDCINSVLPLAKEKSVLIEARIPNSMFVVRCDADLLIQVMNNLLSNAIKFVEEGTGRIRVWIHAGDDELQVWVEDNGKGIPDELHEQVFDKFFQARNQTLKKPQGSGLGLAISKKIIEMHQGRIWVENVQDKGARFIFTLPNR
ncbi:MAG: histidine kinase [Bacteroidetes bacterium]|nr:histidine kinase [Bacteroidota bacterium]